MKQGQKPERYWLVGWRHRLRGQITDEAIRQLKQEPNAASIIYELIEEQGVVIARDIYRKVFEPFNKVEIEQNIERLFFEASFGEYPRSNVEVPDHLLLWVILSEGFGGRKRGTRKSYRQRRSEAFAIKKFEERARELQEVYRVPVGKAKQEAAEEISKSSPISVKRFLEGRFYRHRAPRKKNKKSRISGKPRQE